MDEFQLLQPDYVIRTLGEMRASMCFLDPDPSWLIKAARKGLIDWAFEASDEDMKGYLNREDYKVAVVMLFGYKPSKMEVDSVMASVKQSQSGVSLEEFVKLMSAKKPAHFYYSEVRQLFTAFDRQCKGFLSFEDFKAAFNIVAPKLPERIIVEAFREVDQDSDGHISFRDFESAMNYGQDDFSALPYS